MASFDTSLYTGQTGTAGVSPAVGRLEAKYGCPETKFVLIPYVVDGAEVSGDTINLCQLPEGAIVIPSLCRVVTGTGLDVSDMNVGISGNDNKYADAVDTLDTASDLAFSGGDNHTAPTEETAVVDVIATLVTVVTSTAASTALFIIAYNEN